MGDEFGMRKLRDCYGQMKRVETRDGNGATKDEVRGEKKSRG